MDDMLVVTIELQKKTNGVKSTSGSSASTGGLEPDPGPAFPSRGAATTKEQSTVQGTTQGTT